MNGKTTLRKLVENLSPVLDEQVYVYVSVKDRIFPRSLHPKLVFEESEGTTLIVEQHVAETHNLKFNFLCRQITLNVHSSLEAVGFMAHIAKTLSDHGISVNPVSGFFHDHLFVPASRAEDALRILRDLETKL